MAGGGNYVKKARMFFAAVAVAVEMCFAKLSKREGIGKAILLREEAKLVKYDLPKRT